MSRRKQIPTSAKLLDAWTPPETAGEPLGCVATTFTFKADFFEEECLGRFLQMQTDPAEDGPAYLFEREEKLAQLGCAAVLVDRHHARDFSRSLRWDVLVARPAAGILHAKISLLRWSGLVRLVVASANLTEDGYRRNLEVFAVLDYREGGEAPLPVLEECLDFLREAAATARQEGAASARWNDFLKQVRNDTRTWGLRTPPRGARGVSIFPVMSRPNRPSVFETLGEIANRTGPFTDAYVLSPFFDPPEAPNEPARALWRLLRQRGVASAFYYVDADVSDDGTALVSAPESLRATRPQDTFFQKLNLETNRPLHAKCLSLENERSILRLVGSSNFTSAGLGLGRTKNWEANLAWLIHRDSQPAAARALDAAWPEAEELNQDDLRFEPLKNDDEATSKTAMLPMAFGEAVYACPQTGPEIRLRIEGDPPPGWRLAAEDDDLPLAGEADWLDRGRPDTWVLSWERERPPSGFLVTWTGSPGAAWWPVNALDAAALPPPPELGNLSLEQLIDLLTSARPLHEVLARWLRRREEAESAGPAPATLLDPHKRVDTSAFLLQRTRRVSAALHGLRGRLERPCASEAALHWRLRGPVGVRAFADAVSREANSEVERAFLLLELCLELRRVRPSTAPGCLSVPHVRQALREMTKEIGDQIPAAALDTDPALADYAKAALEEVAA